MPPIRKAQWAQGRQCRMKTATVALVVHYNQDEPTLTTILSDEQEIEIFETAVSEGQPDPMTSLCDFRDRRKKEEEEFGDYVEELLSQPFLRRDIQEHGVQWLRSKIRIEQYQRAELEAARVIADYAYQLYQQNRELRDFFLSGPNTRVRIRIFVVSKAASGAQTNAA
jgi:hypothetical protein